MEYQVPVIVEPLKERGYYAECTLLPGCHVEGETYLEALENLEDVIRIHIEGRIEFGDPLPAELSPLHKAVRFSLELPVMVGV